MPFYKTLTSIGIATFMLSGCGSSSSDALKGTLSLPIQGLKYETQTEAGTTGVDGSFRYATGENVTFYIGDRPLTTLTAAAVISIEDWLGEPLPTNGNRLLNILDNEATHSIFHQQFNNLFLLANLDADQDPSNGIDLSQWQNTPSTNINTDLSMTTFAQDELPTYLEQYNLENINLGTFASHLFSIAGINFPHYLLSEKRTDNDSDGSTNYKSNYEYNDQGMRTFYTYTDSTNGCITREERNEYDDLNQEIFEQVISRSWNTANQSCNLIRNTTYEYVYNDKGSLSSESYAQDSNGDGDTNNSRSTTYTYDSNDNLINQLTHKDTDGDGNSDNIVAYSYSYKNQGQEVVILQTEDSNGDGEINATRTTTQFFDEAGNLLDQEYVDDDDNNPETANIKGSQVYNYSEANILLGFINESDNDGDDIVDRRSYVTYEYNSDGQLLRYNSELDNNGDSDGSTEISSSHNYGYEYNELGQRTFYYYNFYSNADQTIGNRQERNYQYDSNGNQTFYQSKYASNINGDWDRIYSYYDTYDDLGNLITERDEKDRDADGNIDSVEVSQYLYNGYGESGEYYYYLYQELEADVQTGEWTVITYQEEETVNYDNVTGNKISVLYREDNEGDGIFEYEQLAEYDYISMGDGVEFWFNEYID